MKIRSLGVELFHANRRTDGRTDGRTAKHDVTKSRFSPFANAPKVRHIDVGHSSLVVIGIVMTSLSSFQKR